MSLEDKFYPDDGSYLTRFDNFMVRSAGKVGEFYQYVTGRSYKDLVNLVYKASLGGCTFSAGLSVYATAKDINNFYLNIFPVSLGITTLRKFVSLKYESPIEEEIRNEFLYKLPKMGKAERLFRLGISALLISATKILLIAEAEQSEIRYTLLLSGLSGALSVFGDYLSKSNIPKPPEKSLPKRIKGTIRERLSQPQPSPEPI